MEMTMNPEDVVTRKEFEKVVKELRTEKAVPEHLRDDVVRRGEFQLLLWMGAFVLTSVLGGFTFLYLELADLRVAMGDRHADLLERIVRLEEGQVQLKEGLVQLKEGQVQLKEELVQLKEELVQLEERVTQVETLLSK